MNNITKNVLATELKYFRRKKSDFLQTYKDQFVLIKGEQLIGAFSTEVEAYKAGVEKFSNEPFLIKKVVDSEAAASIPALTLGVIDGRLQ